MREAIEGVCIECLALLLNILAINLIGPAYPATAQIAMK